MVVLTKAAALPRRVVLAPMLRCRHGGGPGGRVCGRSGPAGRDRRLSLFQPRPGAHHHGPAQLASSQHGGAVGRHGRLRADLHAGVVTDRRRYELVASGADHRPRQHHRVGADDPERPRRDQVRHPLSRVLPTGLRHSRRQRPRAAPRLRRLRVVRHPDVDRGLGHLQDPRSVPAELEDAPDACLLRHQPAAVSLLPLLLGHQPRCDLSRNRLHPLPARDQGALADRPRTGASRLGLSGSGRLRADAAPALAVRGGRAEGRGVLAVLLSGADRQRGVLGDLSLNIPDFTRYARSQRDQALGQAIALPPAMGLFSFIGVAVTSGTIVIFGKAIWDPVELVAGFEAPLVHVVALLGLCLATLATNLAANVVSPANDFANLWPKCISFRTGGLITGLVGIVMQPWKLIADYFLVRHTSLDLPGLYREGGPYWYRRGFHVPALVALAAGVAPCLPGSLATVADVKVPAAWTR